MYRVLNVDDKAAQRYSRARLLAKAGFEVVDAATGEHALQLSTSEKPAVIILDLHLPDIDGTELTRHLKADASTASIRILQISAEVAGDAFHAVALKAGADAFLVEPVHPEIFTATVLMLARNWQVEHDLRRELLRCMRDGGAQKEV